jgi:hypothetical protein
LIHRSNRPLRKKRDGRISNLEAEKAPEDEPSARDHKLPTPSLGIMAITDKEAPERVAIKERTAAPSPGCNGDDAIALPVTLQIAPPLELLECANELETNVASMERPLLSIYWMLRDSNWKQPRGKNSTGLFVAAS